MVTIGISNRVQKYNILCFITDTLIKGNFTENNTEFNVMTTPLKEEEIGNLTCVLKLCVDAGYCMMKEITKSIKFVKEDDCNIDSCSVDISID